MAHRGGAFAAAGARERDSDSEEEDEHMGPAASYYAKRMRLRLQLQRWEREFEAVHSRASAYEDKKLDSRYQHLRSQLRSVELEFRSAQQHDLTEEDLMSVRSSCSGLSSRSGRSFSATRVRTPTRAVAR